MTFVLVFEITGAHGLLLSKRKQSQVSQHSYLFLSFIFIVTVV